jgi:hypothetical protein
MTRRNPFSYRIDYAAEIANDEKLVAWCEKVKPVADAIPEIYFARGWSTDAPTLAVNHAPLAAMLAVSESERADLAAMFDLDAPDLPDPEPRWYGRAEAVVKRLNAEWGEGSIPSPMRLAKMRQLAKARIATHRRKLERGAA